MERGDFSEDSIGSNAYIFALYGHCSQDGVENDGTLVRVLEVLAAEAQGKEQRITGRYLHLLVLLLGSHSVDDGSEDLVGRRSKHLRGLWSLVKDNSGHIQSPRK